jgi:hypothetical protein
MGRMNHHIAVARPVLADRPKRILTAPEPVREEDHRIRAARSGIVDLVGYILFPSQISQGKLVRGFDRQRPLLRLDQFISHSRLKEEGDGNGDGNNELAHGHSLAITKLRCSFGFNPIRAV